MGPDCAGNQELLCRRGPGEIYWTGLKLVSYGLQLGVSYDTFAIQQGREYGVEEPPILGAMTKQRPVNTITRWDLACAVVSWIV
jgi:hypothetical protein